MNRRQLLTRIVLVRIVQGFSLTGLGFLAYPFVKFMLPSFDEALNLDVTVGELKPGQSKTVFWRGRSLVVLKRTGQVLRYLNDPHLQLKDTDSFRSVQPESARNSHRSVRPDIFVAYTNCTHLACEVALGGDDGIGFTCPCHQSEYDHAGRVLTGAAANFNLEIPHYRFLSRNLIRLETGGS